MAKRKELDARTLRAVARACRREAKWYAEWSAKASNVALGNEYERGRYVAHSIALECEQQARVIERKAAR